MLWKVWQLKLDWLDLCGNHFWTLLMPSSFLHIHAVASWERHYSSWNASIAVCWSTFTMIETVAVCTAIYMNYAVIERISSSLLWHSPVHMIQWVLSSTNCLSMSIAIASCSVPPTILCSSDGCRESRKRALKEAFIASTAVLNETGRLKSYSMIVALPTILLPMDVAQVQALFLWRQRRTIMQWGWRLCRWQQMLRSYVFLGLHCVKDSKMTPFSGYSELRLSIWGCFHWLLSCT